MQKFIPFSCLDCGQDGGMECRILEDAPRYDLAEEEAIIWVGSFPEQYYRVDRRAVFEAEGPGFAEQGRDEFVRTLPTTHADKLRECSQYKATSLMGEADMLKYDIIAKRFFGGFPSNNRLNPDWYSAGFVQKVKELFR